MRQCGDCHINRIYLMLGNACNFKCQYCLQANMKYCKPHEPTENVYQYIEHLIKSRPRYLSNLTLLFWGGEPLLYIDIIKKVIDRFSYTDKLRYTIVTNGELITDELVSYFNDHNVHITLSHDGINTACTRGKNVLNNPKYVKMVSKIKDFSIESVTSKYNYDYASLFEYFDSVFEKDIPVSVDMLRVTWNMPKDLYDIPIDDYETKLRYLAGQALEDTINMKSTKAVNLFYPYIVRLSNNKISSIPKCGAFYHSVDIDCDGNVFTCHNDGTIVGNVGERRLTIAPRYEKWLSEHLDTECSECEVFDVCGGGCPLECGYRQYSCGIYKVFYSVCLDLAVAIENSIEPIDWSVNDYD